MKEILEHIDKLTEGSGLDVHKLLGRLPRPKRGWVLPYYRYCGPYNPLEQQIDDGGNPLPGHKPYNQVDDVCRVHDIAYGRAKNKQDKQKADKIMLQQLEEIKPRSIRERFDRAMIKGIIGAKYKLGLGLTNDQENLLKKLYYDPSTGYSGINDLSRRSKLPAKDVKEWLVSQETYTKHKPAKQRFPTRRVQVHQVDHQWQADLADMRSLKEYNDNTNYILTVIDVLSKYAWAVPIKRKTGDEITDAFKGILKERKPAFIQTDKGTEFINKATQKLLKDQGIHWFATENETKAQIVERFNRTLKGKMYKYFTAKNTKRWVDVLSELVKNYNNSYHRSIKMTPQEAVNNGKDAWKNLYAKRVKAKKPKFKVGQFVRISKYRGMFKRGYTANYTDEVFVITDVLATVPTTYRISEIRNADKIIGTFYEEELSLFKPKHISQII